MARKKSGRRKTHRRPRGSAQTSSTACAKVMDKCGMSKSYCDDSGFRKLLKEAKANYSAEVKSIREGLTAAAHNRGVALKSCRKTIKADRQRESVAAHMRASISRINGFKRRVRR